MFWRNGHGALPLVVAFSRLRNDEVEVREARLTLIAKCRKFRGPYAFSSLTFFTHTPKQTNSTRSLLASFFTRCVPAS